MADNTGNPMLDAWIEGQKQFLRAQAPLMDQWKAMLGGGDLSAAAVQAQESWDLAQRQFRDWLDASTRLFPGASDSTGEGIASETLRHMLDPGQFLYAGSDEVNQAIQRLVEGPEFADIGTLERRVLKASSEWFALREASAAYRAVTAAAWQRAFERFSREVVSDRDAFRKNPREVLDRWLEIANEELINTQRTSDFLDAQRRLLRAGVDYRIRERELVEVWCETHSMPTRTEIDDLHRIVYDLRHKVRALERDLAAIKAPKPRPQRPARRRKTEVKND